MGSRSAPSLILSTELPARTRGRLGEAEITSQHCQAPAGAPQAPALTRDGGAGRQGRRVFAAQSQQEAERQAALEKLAQWRASATADTWKGVRRKFNDADVEIALLCYNMQDRVKDEDIDCGFAMAKGLGVKGITTGTTLTMAKRIAPIADRHKMVVGYHGHDATSDPNQTATLESYETLMAYAKYNAISLDIGHFTAAGYDAVAFIKQNHDRITNLHVKDREKNHGPNIAVWGTGDTPIKEVMQLKRRKLSFNDEKIPGLPAGRAESFPVSGESCFPAISATRSSAVPTSLAEVCACGSLVDQLP